MKALRKSLIASLGFAILVAALVPSVGEARGFGFAFGLANRRVAGSYLGELNDGSNLTPGLFTFNRDGTAQASFSNEGDIGTPMYGAWRSTGFREISGTFLDFIYDQDGNLTGILRADFTHTFLDKHFNTFEGDVVVSIFSSPNDPLAPDPVPDFGPFEFTVSGQRIPAAGIMP
jgi:YD repeat-containing protein